MNSGVQKQKNPSLSLPCPPKACSPRLVQLLTFISAAEAGPRPLTSASASACPPCTVPTGLCTVSSASLGSRLPPRAAAPLQRLSPPSESPLGGVLLLPLSISAPTPARLSGFGTSRLSCNRIGSPGQPRGGAGELLLLIGCCGRHSESRARGPEGPGAGRVSCSLVGSGPAGRRASRRAPRLPQPLPGREPGRGVRRCGGRAEWVSPAERGGKRAGPRERGGEQRRPEGDRDSSQRRYAPQRPCPGLAPAAHLCGLERSVPALPPACRASL